MPDKERFCYVVLAGQRNSNGFIPSAVFEGVDGHYPLVGRGSHATPWYWGETWEVAERICADANRELGLTPDDVDEIVSSSITAQLRGDTRKAAVEERMKQLGLKPLNPDEAMRRLLSGTLPREAVVAEDSDA